MIVLENISKEYKNGVHALRDVTLTIEDGEFVYIIGPTGSGKSTMIKIAGWGRNSNFWKSAGGEYRCWKTETFQSPYLSKKYRCCFSGLSFAAKINSI